MSELENQVRMVLKLLEALTTPDKTKQDGITKDNSNPEENGFDLLLKTNLAIYQDILHTDRYQNVRILLKDSVTMDTGVNNCRWRFVCACLETLALLQKTISMAMEEFTKKSKETALPELRPGQAPPLTPDSLSIGHQKMVLTAVQFIVILGISEKLDVGVGIPMERRSEFAKLLLLSSKHDEVSKESRNACLFSCVKVFMCLLGIPSLASLVLSRHLNDLLASLLTLLHNSDTGSLQVTHPDLRKNTEKVHQDSTNITEVTTQERSSLSSLAPSNWTPAMVVDLVRDKQLTKKENVEKEIFDLEEPSDKTDLHREKSREDGESVTYMSLSQLQQCETWLQQLLRKTPPPILVRELLLLQSGAPAPPKQVGTAKRMLTSPVWLRKVCGRLLTDILVKPKGVIHVLQGMLEGPCREKAKSTGSDWRKCDAAAKVIACCPMSTTSVEEYYTLVSPQILSLLHHPESTVRQEFLRVACTTIARMMDQQPELARKYVLSPLLQPLERCSEPNAIRSEKLCLVEEVELTMCLEDLHRVFVVGCEPSTPLIRCLLPVSHTIFLLLCYTKKGVSHLSKYCDEVLVSLLKGLDKNNAVTCLHKWILGTAHQEKAVSKDADKNYPIMIARTHQDVRFSAGDGGGIRIFVDSNHGDQGAVTNEMTISAALCILKELEKSGLTGEFFLVLLMELTEIINREIHGDVGEITTRGGQELMEAEIREKQMIDNFHRKVSVLNLLAAICDEIGPSCLKNTQQTLKFVQATLERGVQVCKNTDDEVLGVFEGETLTMAMGMLTAVLTGTIKITEDDREFMKKLMPLLEDISSNHSDDSVQEMATDLRVAIATHGVIWSELLKSSTKAEKPPKVPSEESKVIVESKEDNKPLVEIISETSVESLQKLQTSGEEGQPCSTDGEPQLQSTIKTGQKKEIATEMSALGQAFEELHDPLIPVRGHALITMNKLIQTKDPEAIEKREILLNVFKENLHHPDSYLYLSSVNGLVSLVDKFPDVVIPVLTDEFLSGKTTPTVQGDSTRKADDRIKVGECLVQTSRKLGDMSPRYRDKLLMTFLQGCKHSDHLIRASSLSNLGELCKVLRFSLGNFIHLIFNCVCALLKSDPSVEVRQASAMMVCLQLEGLGKDTLKVLESVIRDVYRTLRRCMMTEKDDEVKMQITLALNTLDSITREIMFPKQTMEKKIRILDTS